MIWLRHFKIYIVKKIWNILTSFEFSWFTFLIYTHNYTSRLSLRCVYHQELLSSTASTFFRYQFRFISYNLHYYQCLILLHLSTPHQEMTSLGKLISWPWRLMPGWRSCKVLTQLWRPLSTLLLQLCTAAKGRGHLWSLIPPKLQ